MTFQSTVNMFTVLSKVILCLQYCQWWKQGQYMFTVLWKVNICLQYSERSIYVYSSFSVQLNLVVTFTIVDLVKLKKNIYVNVYSLLDLFIFIRSSWFGHLNQPLLTQLACHCACSFQPAQMLRMRKEVPAALPFNSKVPKLPVQRLKCPC